MPGITYNIIIPPCLYLNTLKVEKSREVKNEFIALVQPQGLCPDVQSRVAKVNAECCDEPTEDCSSGNPATCNIGCAQIALPFFNDCAGVLSKENSAAYADFAALCRTAKLATGASAATGSAPAGGASLMAPGYLVSGCADEIASNCGSFHQVKARCTCQGREMQKEKCHGARCDADPTTCGGAPVYMQISEKEKCMNDMVTSERGQCNTVLFRLYGGHKFIRHFPVMSIIRNSLYRKKQGSGE
jgi:hypothetical protein